MENIASRIPMDKTAAMAVQKGIHFEPKMKKSNCVTLDVKPDIKKQWPPTGFELVGHRFGRFTVIGLSADYPGRWVVRCDCGKHEFRSAKAARNPKNNDDGCIFCRKWNDIKRSYSRCEYFKIHGEWPPDTF